MGGWLGLSLRHLLFVLPPACIALSQARLSPLPGSTARVVVATAAMASAAATLPAGSRLLEAALGSGAAPWMRLCAAEALAALALAAGGTAAWAGGTRAGVRLLRRTLPRATQRAARLHWLGAAAAAGSAAALPPGIPAWLGCLCLAARLAAGCGDGAFGGDERQVSGSPDGAAKAAAPLPHRALAWLSFSSLLALLPGVELFSWLAGGGARVLPWSDGRALVMVLALHACLLRVRAGAAQRSGQARGRGGWACGLAAAAAHEGAAAAAGAASLLGHPWACLHAAAVSAAVDTLLGM